MFYDNLEDEIEHYKTEYFHGFSSKRFNLIVFIENYDDEPFWKFVISESENKNLKPFFMNMEGKKTLLKYEYLFDRDFIGCVDSDYDYILKKEYLNNKYIFHTYVYSIENYCTCAKTINSLLDSLNIPCNLNFELLFTRMSNVIENTLLYDIYLMEQKQDSIRNILKFNNFPEDITSEDSIINYIESNIKNKNLSFNESNFEIHKKTILENENINENFLHLYVEGHIVFDSIMHIITKIAKEDFTKKLYDIRNNESYTGDVKKQKINEVKNKSLDLHTGLKLNYKLCYYNHSCPSFKKIIQDISTSL